MSQFTKEQIIGLLAAFTFAFSIFQGFEPFIDFCVFIAPLVEFWRKYTYAFWRILLSWVQIPIPVSVFDFLNGLILSASIFLRSEVTGQNIYRKLGWHKASDLLNSPANTWRYKTRFISALAVLTLLLFPSVFHEEEPFHTMNSINTILMSFASIASYFAKVGLVVAVILYLHFESATNAEISRAARTYFSKWFWDVIFLVLLLCALNAVGKLYDSQSSRVPNQNRTELELTDFRG